MWVTRLLLFWPATPPFKIDVRLKCVFQKIKCAVGTGWVPGLSVWPTKLYEYCLVIAALSWWGGGIWSFFAHTQVNPHCPISACFGTSKPRFREDTYLHDCTLTKIPKSYGNFGIYMACTKPGFQGFPHRRKMAKVKIFRPQGRKNRIFRKHENREDIPLRRCLMTKNLKKYGNSDICMCIMGCTKIHADPLWPLCVTWDIWGVPCFAQVTPHSLGNTWNTCFHAGHSDAIQSIFFRNFYLCVTTTSFSSKISIFDFWPIWAIFDPPPRAKIFPKVKIFCP